MLSGMNLIFFPQQTGLKIVQSALILRRGAEIQPHLHCYKYLPHGVPSNAEQLIFAMLVASYIDIA